MAESNQASDLMAARIAAFTCVYYAKACHDQLVSTKVEYIEYHDRSAVKAEPIENYNRADFEKVVSGSIKLLSYAVEKHQSIDGNVYEQILLANADRVAVRNVGEDCEPTAHQAARHVAFAVLHSIESQAESGLEPVEFLDAVLKSFPAIDYGILKSEIHIEYANAVRRLIKTPTDVASATVETLSVKQVAEMKCCDHTTVRAWCAYSEFEKDKGVWLIPRGKAEAWTPRPKATKEKTSPKKLSRSYKWECASCCNTVDRDSKPDKCGKCGRSAFTRINPANPRAQELHSRNP